MALEGFSHLIPFAAGHEMIRQQRRDLTLVRLTPDIIYDQMIGMGCASKPFSPGQAIPVSGCCIAFRGRRERSASRPMRWRSIPMPGLAAAIAAGAADCRSAYCRALPRRILSNTTPDGDGDEMSVYRREFTAVRAVNPDVTIIHAQCADSIGKRSTLGDCRHPERSRLRSTAGHRNRRGDL